MKVGFACALEGRQTMSLSYPMPEITVQTPGGWCCFWLPEHYRAERP